MNVLYIISATFMGGATISFLTMLKGIRKKGFVPFVVIPDGRREFIDVLERLNITYFIVPLAYSSYDRIRSLRDFLAFPKRMAKRMRTIMRAESAINKIIKENKIDIVHTNVGPLRVGFNCAQKLQIPHVWHIREYGDLDFQIYEFPSKKYFQSLLKKSYVITITKDLLKYNRLQQYNKAKVIYNGVMSEADAFFDSIKENYFLCASRVSPEKGHHNVIRAFGEFCKVNNIYSIKILGDGPNNYIRQLKQLSVECGCSDKIDFLGFKNDVKPFMKKAKALIVASPNEGFGRMTAEALFCGCLVVGMNAAGTKEILDETDGLMFSNNSELLSALLKVDGLTEQQYATIVLSAQDVAKGLYSNESYVENVYCMYKEILNR